LEELEADPHSGAGLYGNGLIWVMWDRAPSFLLSLGFVTAGLVVGGWLIANGEVRSFDGLFLFSTCLVIAFAFGLYLRWLLRTAVSEAHLHPPRATAEQLASRSVSDAETTAVLPRMH
jgi:hypothetical protein